jgi:Tannase and feruloyl esterase
MTVRYTPLIAIGAFAATQVRARVPVRTRPLCPYPKVAKYKGTGDVKRAESFTCAAS